MWIMRSLHALKLSVITGPYIQSGAPRVAFARDPDGECGNSNQRVHHHQQEQMEETSTGEGARCPPVILHRSSIIVVRRLPGRRWCHHRTRPTRQRTAFADHYVRWTQLDIVAHRYMTAKKGGPEWGTVVRRLTHLDGQLTEHLEVDHTITGVDYHGPLPRQARRLRTVLLVRKGACAYYGVWR